MILILQENALGISEQCCCEENNISQQCALVVKAAKHIPGCVSQGAASRSRAWMFLCSALGRPCLMDCVYLGVPQTQQSQSTYSRLHTDQRVGALSVRRR